MSQSNRREFIALAAAGSALLAANEPAAAATPPAMSLKEALSMRRSTRLYTAEPIAEDMLAEILWAAAGVNRPESGGRTAPSWHTSYGTDIHVADAGGVRTFDPAAGTLVPRLGDDIRGKASPQPFVAAAPTVLIYVADLSRMYKAPREEQVQAAHVDAGIIAQNVYLHCASVGLGTCLVGGADKKGLTAILNLPEAQFVTFVQPIGHPKQGS